MLSGEIGPGSVVVVDAEDDRVVVRFEAAGGTDRMPDAETVGSAAA
jgi:RNA 3'-terminal phosphate cyclase